VKHPPLKVKGRLALFRRLGRSGKLLPAPYRDATNLPGYVGFFQFLRNFRQQNACEQAELILQAALDPTIARRAKRREFVKCLDHFDLLQTAINCNEPVKG
jgi:hypothetical protein